MLISIHSCASMNSISIQMVVLFCFCKFTIILFDKLHGISKQYMQLFILCLYTGAEWQAILVPLIIKRCTTKLTTFFFTHQYPPLPWQKHLLTHLDTSDILLILQILSWIVYPENKLLVARRSRIYCCECILQYSF